MAPQKEKVLQDCLFLASIVLLSVILYIKGLGFYGLDWNSLRVLSMAQEQSLFSLFQSLYGDHVKMQPGKILYHAGLYKLFGLNPFGYHIFNHAVFLLNVLLFYVTLRHLYDKRLFAISAALVYAFLPHYSSVRFFVQGFEFNLALTFYFLSLYSDLRAVRARPAGFWGWKFSSLLSLICSMLVHPIAMALFLLYPIFVWYREKRMRGERLNKRADPTRNSLTEIVRTNPRVLFYMTLAAVLPIMNLNILTAIELGSSNFSHIFKHIIDVNYSTYGWGLNYVHAMAVAYGSYGIGLPLVVWSSILNHSNLATFVVAGLLGLGIYFFLYSTIKRSRNGHIDRIYIIKFIKHGFIVFFLGYGAYLIDVRVRFSSTGAVNVAAVAAALGVALTMIGFLGWISTIFRSKRIRRQSFCLFVALFCTSGFFVNNYIASFWVAANEQQQEILNDIRETFPMLSSGSTMILDGICPYIGPATVFESNWDLEGALKIRYQDNTIRADIVTPDLGIKENMLRTSHYGVQNYPFKNLVIYNYQKKKSYPLSNAEDARHYFEMINPNYKVNCKDGRVGFGEPIFKIKSLVVR